MYTLFTDTDNDITPEIAKRYGYKLISMPYMIGEKQTYPYVDFDVFDGHAYYDLLRNGVLPSTSALSPGEYIKHFEPEFAAGNDILYVHFSSAMSATFNSMRLAIEELKEKYPEREVYTVDTKAITIGSCAICMEIGKLYKEGKSIQEIQAWAEKEVPHFATYFYVDTLKFFAKSGRVNGFAALMGGIIGLKPIIYINDEGVMTTKDKVRGKKAALLRLLDYVDSLQENIKDYQIVVGHTDCPETVNTFIDMLHEKYGNDLNIEVVYGNPTTGSHCGPDCMGISFHAKNR